MSAAQPVPTEGLEVHDVEDGLVVYDTATSRVHYLNATATLVFEVCDGTRSADAIVELVASTWGPDEPNLEQVRACLGQLRAEGVVN
jgi:PqqD family protein of HPr-rel-A system